MAQESKVQIAPESTGPKVRTLKIGTILEDGTPATVEIQAVTISDAQGNLLEVVDPEWKASVLMELRTIRTTLWEMLGRITLPGGPLSS